MSAGNAARMLPADCRSKGSSVKSFEGKTVIITGGSSGIGRATAIASGREGGQVVIADAQPGESEKTPQYVRKAGGPGIFVRTDVTKSAEVEAMVLKTIETYGGLDCDAQSGIRVNAMCPGMARIPPVEKGLEDAAKMAVWNAKVPMGRLGEPGEIAAAVLWLSSDAASFVTGHTLAADGGRMAA